MIEYLSKNGRVVLWIGINLVLYLFCSFVALDFNPADWWLFGHPIGRIIIGIAEVIMSLVIFLDKDFDDLEDIFN